VNFTGLRDNRLAVESQRGFSWTDTQFKVNGMDATDSYQPGLPVVLPDTEALAEVAVHSPFDQAASSSYGGAIGLFLAEPRAFTQWHGTLSSANTGALFSSANLPALGNRGLVQQTDQYRWFTRDRLEIGGPLARWADFYASASGQWDAQTEPLATPGTDQRSRLLFANARGRVRAGAHDLFDALYSGSRIDLSDGGIPAGLEAVTGNRIAPSFALPGGFPGQPEVDHMDFLQTGWTHVAATGPIEVRYGYSTAHLDTDTVVNGQKPHRAVGRHGLWRAAAGQSGRPYPAGNRCSLADGDFTSSPSVCRRRVEDIGASQPFQHTLRRESDHRRRGSSIYGEVQHAGRFASAGPVLLGYLADHVSVTRSLLLDLGGYADFSRGSLPGGPALIAWNNISPRAGFAWHSHGLVIRGAYSRLYAALAGRYLDFGDPNSLGGSVYEWNGSEQAKPAGAVRRTVLVDFTWSAASLLG